MPIDPLPSISRSDANFRTQVDDYFLTRLPAFSTQAESARVQIVAAESTATSAASAAATAATTASTAAGTATSASASAVTAKNAAEAAAANAISTPVAAPIHAAPSKAAPVDADELGLSDSAASWGLKKLTFANLKAWISGLFVPKTGNSTITGQITLGADIGVTGGKIRFQGVGGGTADFVIGKNDALTSFAEISNTSDGFLAISQPGALGELSISSGGRLSLHAGGARALEIDQSRNVLVTDGGALGYGIGSGGAVTQATSKSTAVTLNKPTGRITTHTAALAAGASVQFVVNNTVADAHDLVTINILDVALRYRAECVYAQSGRFDIALTNLTAGSLSEAVPIKFSISKGAVT